MMNIVNGGVHADNRIDFQEFMVMPVGAPSFAEALRCGAEIFHALKSALHEAGFSTAVGDEGGFAPDLSRLAKRWISSSARWRAQAMRRAVDVLLAMDPAASEFFRDGRYELTGEGKSLSPEEMAIISSAWPRIIRSRRSRTGWPRTTGPVGS